MTRVRSAALDRLATFMQQPMQQVSVEELQQLWQHDDLEFVCRRPLQLEDAPDLPQRVRGALGNELEALCSFAPRRRDPFDRETAYELLFGWPNPKIRIGRDMREIAVPFTILTDVAGDEVRVVIRLFGMAGIHLRWVQQAAIAALEGGVALRRAAVRVPFPVLSAQWRRFDGAARHWLADASAVLIRLRTPVVIRSGEGGSGNGPAWVAPADRSRRSARKVQGLRLEPAALLRSAVWRAASLAPWMGCNLVADFDGLGRAIDCVRFAQGLAIHPESWKRHSKNTGDEGIRVDAYGGEIRAEGSIGALLPFLELAALGNLGASCASGFGRLDLITYP